MNEALKSTAKRAGVRLWEVAEALGVRDFELSRLMRHPLDAELEAKALAAVEEIRAKRDQGMQGGDSDDEGLSGLRND